MSNYAVKCHHVLVGDTPVTLVSQAYLAAVNQDGRIPAIFASAPFLILGGEGYYVVQSDEEVARSLNDEVTVLLEDYEVPETTVQISEESLAVLVAQLDHLADMEEDLETVKASLEAEFRARLEAEIGEDAVVAYDNLRREYDALVRENTAQVSQEIADYTEYLRDEVVKVGRTIKGQRKQAVYNGGKISWNTKGLLGYALAHPAIKQFSTTGAPFVSIRTVK